MNAMTATEIARQVANTAGADHYVNIEGLLVISRADGAQMGVMDDGAGWSSKEWINDGWEFTDGEWETDTADVERHVLDWLAKADPATRALTATVTGHDAGGHERSVVEWIPQDVTEMVNDLTGAPQVFVGTDVDQPPVHVGRSAATGHTTLEPHVESLAGQSFYTHEWARVDSRTELRPGAYRIVEDTNQTSGT